MDLSGRFLKRMKTGLATHVHTRTPTPENPLISRLNLGVGDAFVDDSFPPSGRSLYYNRQCPSLEPELARDRQIVSQWLRPGQIVAEGDQKIKWTVFRTPLPSDISQG